MRREARIRTWRSENFFSSSRVRLGVGVSDEDCGRGRRERDSRAVGAYRCWTLWKPWRRGTGTKMTMAFLPWLTSIWGGMVLVRGRYTVMRDVGLCRAQMIPSQFVHVVIR